jgi:hypothetical protein
MPVVKQWWVAWYLRSRPWAKNRIEKLKLDAGWDFGWDFGLDFDLSF